MCGWRTLTFHILDVPLPTGNTKPWLQPTSSLLLTEGALTVMGFSLLLHLTGITKTERHKEQQVWSSESFTSKWWEQKRFCKALKCHRWKSQNWGGCICNRKTKPKPAIKSSRKHSGAHPSVLTQKPSTLLKDTATQNSSVTTHDGHLIAPPIGTDHRPPTNLSRPGRTCRHPPAWEP